MAGRYPFSRKLVCAECGKVYYRTRQFLKSGERTVWKCSTFLSGGRTGRETGGAGCGNIHLSEEGIWQGIQEAFAAESAFERKEWEELEKETVRILKKALQPPDSKARLAAYGKEYGKLASRKDVLMEKLLAGVISDEDFKRYHGDISGQMKILSEKINGIKDGQKQYNSYEMRILKIKEELEKGNLVRKALAMEVLRWTDHIEVHRDGTLALWLNGDMAGEASWAFRGKEGKEKGSLYCVCAEYIREHL